MTMHKLGITYNYTDKLWTGEYQFIGTRIWDSARLLKEDMYREGQLQCLSFGYDKPLEIGRGGAVLTDDVEVYDTLNINAMMGATCLLVHGNNKRYSKIGYHYKPTIEEAVKGLELLPNIDQEPKYKEYPDLREITIIS
jgi:hypothetical protein